MEYDERSFRVPLSTLLQDEDSSRIRTLFWNLLAEYRNYKTKFNCMNDPKDFQDAESVRSGNSHVTSRPVSFPPHPIPEGMLSRFIGMPSRREGPPSIWDTHGKSGNVFANPAASSSAPFPQESNPWVSNVSEHASQPVMSENQTQDQDQRCPVTQKFCHLQWRRLFKELWGRLTTTFILTNSLHQPRLLAGR